ncbi:LLM class flavin-dependent oxidoreductase, partial [Amycolatopsis mediterranei]|uniref:LLM class flavin-dependent oxidoreductase n=1 Tax=Amycolatopsis mediterranei TaxID=33910 RepID=UPI003333E6AE
MLALSVFPDVANLPLRPPAMPAKAAAALDVVSGGRFELALGAGGYWDAITRMGVPRRTPREANAALREAIAVLRALWADGPAPVELAGEFYSVGGVPPGPAPAHPIEIWTGAQGPNALTLTGEIADGWAAPIAPYLPYEKWPAPHRSIDEAAVALG